MGTDHTANTDRRGLRVSIVTKLAVLVAFIVIFSASLMNWIGFRFARASLTEQIQQRLDAVAHHTEQRLNAYVAQKKKEVRLVASRTQLRKYLEERLDSQESGSQAAADFHSGTQRILLDAKRSSSRDMPDEETPEFLDIWITDLNGQVVAATDDKYLNPPRDFAGHHAFEQGKEASYLGTPRPAGDRFEAYLTAPARRGEVFLGVVMVLLDVDGLQSVLADTKGLGQTGEVLVAARDGDRLQYLLPPLKRPEQTSIAADRAEPLVQAIERQRPGHNISVYDGEPVLAAWRLIEYQEQDVGRWAMVVKMDQAEAYAPIADLQRRQWIMEACLVGLGIVVAFLMAKGFTRPIQRMTGTARAIAKGDLGARVSATASDELGQLASAFNDMADELQQLTGNLEQRVSERAKQLQDRTEELSRANQLLTRQTSDLADANDELRRSNQDLDDFAYITSHDLKEPLRGISNYTSFLAEDYEDQLDDEGRERIAAMQRLCRRMESLIDSLLKYSRVGRADLAIQKTDLNELLAEILDTLHVTLEKEHVNVRIPQPLPTMTCDAVRVRELLRNLITNAIKYNDKQEKWIEIGVSNAAADESVRDDYEQSHARPVVLYVQDNGIGIQEKHSETVFKIFKRLHGRDQFGGGTGAGLTFAKKIVERHGGQIWLESEKGVGSTFFFTLQRQRRGSGSSTAASLES